MKKSANRLSQSLTAVIEHTTAGLSEKNAKKLRKAIRSTVSKIARQVSKSLRAEQKITEKSYRKATRSSLKLLMLQLHKALSKSFAAPARAGKHLRIAA